MYLQSIKNILCLSYDLPYVKIFTRVTGFITIKPVTRVKIYAV